MFQELYKVQSLAELCESLSLSPYLLRKKLAEHGVELRKRGGPNRVKLVEFSAQIAEDMKNKGVGVVAKELGVSKYMLFKRRKAWAAAQPTAPPPEESLPPDPSAPQDPREE
jgi:hypothetical protein